MKDVMTSLKVGVGVLLPLLLSLLLLAHSSTARAVNPAYPDLTYWEQWALDNSYTISNYVYSEGTTTGQDGEIGNEFICIRDDVNQVIIGRPDVCGTYYNGLGYSFADITTDPTTLTAAPDIIDAATGNILDQNLQNWGGCNYTGNDNLGGTNPGGPQPNCGANIINWSYQGYWVYRRHAIEQALKQAGVNVDGYTWQFRIKNLNGGRADQSGTDTLNVYMRIWDRNGNEVHQKLWSYNWQFDWTTFSGTELFANPLLGENLDSWQLQMYGRDTGYWSGYYGPEMDIGNSEINMIYSSNPCAIDPLLHPDCEGFVDAYANYLYDQNCIANPLYDSGCPNYQQAFYEQQCNANPLYDVGCPNYAQAYFDQQCSFNPLYDVGCSGYEQAYFEQQCSADPLYDTGCFGYEQAYLDQQCSIDPLYDSTCTGYAEAYYDQQCGLDPLYDSGCAGYQQAYYDQQCGLNSLYDTGCPNYEQAYYEYQCSLNPLYDSGCSGYEAAYHQQQCGLNPLYDTTCAGYEEAYFVQQCTADPLYNSGCDGYPDAYYNQQCGLDPLYDSGCAGYDIAYYNQQCSLDPLYDQFCNGYEQAYYDQQCSINPLYDTGCIGYSDAYFNQQCSLDPLYDTGCDGYAEAVAEKYVQPQNTSTETEVSSTSETTVPVTDPEEIGNPSTTGDATVDSVLREIADVPTTTVVMESSTVETVATVPETQETETETETSAEADSAGEMEELVADVETETESSDESTTDESADGDDSESSDESEGKDSDGGDSKSEKKDSKREKLKKAIAKKATQLADQMSQAASLEAQQAAQATVLALINYVPDFNTYSKMMNGGYLPDANGYPDSNVPESRRGLRNGLAQQLLHEKMVEQQYENLNR